MTDYERDEILIRVDEGLKDLKHQLLGNGQPGIIQKQEGKISELEDFRSKAKGALGVILFLVSVVGGTELVRFLGGA